MPFTKIGKLGPPSEAKQEIGLGLSPRTLDADLLEVPYFKVDIFFSLQSFFYQYDHD